MKIVLIAIIFFGLGMLSNQFLQTTPQNSELNTTSSTNSQATTQKTATANAEQPPAVTPTPQLNSEKISNISSRSTLESISKSQKVAQENLETYDNHQEPLSSTDHQNPTAEQEKALLISEKLNTFLHEHAQTMVYDENVECTQQNCEISMLAEINTQNFTMQLMQHLNGLNQGKTFLKTYSEGEDGLKRITLHIGSD
ncbi:MAG: hypothetical protein AAGB12_03005 [Pseudomonadota bacterium]